MSRLPTLDEARTRRHLNPAPDPWDTPDVLGLDYEPDWARPEITDWDDTAPAPAVDTRQEAA